MSSPRPTSFTSRTVDGVLTAAIVVAIVSTGIRLLDRARRHQLWWDDGSVFVAMIASIITQIVVPFWNAADVPQSHRVAIFYIVQTTYYAIVWACRASILLTVIRLTSASAMRTFLWVSLALFAIFWCILTGQVVVVCIRQPGWEDIRPLPACNLGRDIAISGLTTQLFSDLVLLFAPLNLIANARMARRRKILPLVVFSSNIALTATGFYRGYEVYFKGAGPWQATAAALENAVDLFMANLTVLVGMALRLRGYHLDEGAERATPRFTSISFGGTSMTREVKFPTLRRPEAAHLDVETQRDGKSQSLTHIEMIDRAS